MIHSRIYTGDGQSLVDPPLEHLREWCADPQALIWLDLEGADSNVVEMVASYFNLMHLTVEDILNQKQRAKMERFEVAPSNYVVIVMHGLTFDGQTGAVTTPELDIVLGHNFLITAHSAELAVIQDDHHDPERQCQLVGKSPSYALYTVVDRLVDSYFPVLDAMDDAVERLQDEIVTEPTPQVLQHIFTLKRSLGYARKVISPQLEIFNRLIAREEEFIDARFTVYYRDIYDHLVRSFEVIDSYRDLMSSALDAYLSTVANRQNEVMKRLAVFTSIFMPITFLTGVFGQNFGLMPQVAHDPGYFWWLALLAMILISLLQIIYFWRKGWF